MLYACVGQYAKTPYFVEELGMRLHSIEELCYYLSENITGLDEGIMRSDLCFFIERELGLSDLAKSLLSIVRQKGSLASFVVTILEYAGYKSGDELKHIEKLLRENTALGDAGRKKVRGDYYLLQDSLMKAIREYNSALLLVKEDETTLKASLYHNMGHAYAKLFYFKKAAECFKMAFDTDGNEESYEQYMAALRIGSSREAYVSKVIDLNLDQEKVAKLEERIGAFALESRDDREYQILQQAIADKGVGDVMIARKKLGALIEEWKKEYRKNTEVD